jgi:hypothetical protein
VYPILGVVASVVVSASWMVSQGGLSEARAAVPKLLAPIQARLETHEADNRRTTKEADARFDRLEDKIDRVDSKVDEVLKELRKAKR